ncbi:MAG: FecR family protein [Pseudobacter sp.]|uniref:FecR family protein n=1 Tax=Pseudobacter sp. TaxID=2045420 RepID=UPI003F8039D2
MENQCTSAEAAAVTRYLKKHPDLMTMYLKATWDAAGNETEMPQGYTEEMREAISTQLSKQARIVRFRWLSAAASLLIVAMAGWLLTRQTKMPAQELAKAGKQPAATTSWKQHDNHSARVYQLKLQDGSMVKLSPKSSIKYEDPFGQHGHRNIYMKGTAEFDVIHHKGKPFTVHTKLFTTTVLGTCFKVSESAKTSNVRLFHGKVIIKPQQPKLKGWKKDIVLSPGHEMKYSLEEGVVSVNHFIVSGKQASLLPEIQTDSSTHAETIVFNNTPLLVVMKRLTSKYNAPIYYEEEELKGKFFSGEVLKSDSLSVLLKVITNMNGLQVIQKDDGYLITPSK